MYARIYISNKNVSEFIAVKIERALLKYTSTTGSMMCAYLTNRLRFKYEYSYTRGTKVIANIGDDR